MPKPKARAPHRGVDPTLNIAGIKPHDGETPDVDGAAHLAELLADHDAQRHHYEADALVQPICKRLVDAQDLGPHALAMLIATGRMEIVDRLPDLTVCQRINQPIWHHVLLGRPYVRPEFIEALIKRGISLVEAFPHLLERALRDRAFIDLAKIAARANHAESRLEDLLGHTRWATLPQTFPEIIEIVAEAAVKEVPSWRIGRAAQTFADADMEWAYGVVYLAAQDQGFRIYPSNTKSNLIWACRTASSAHEKIKLQGLMGTLGEFIRTGESRLASIKAQLPESPMV